MLYPILLNTVMWQPCTCTCTCTCTYVRTYVYKKECVTEWVNNSTGKTINRIRLCTATYSHPMLTPTRVTIIGFGARTAVSNWLFPGIYIIVHCIVKVANRTCN